ncbi:MAG: HigA family addiction module antidote protein [Rhizobiales bacterium]|nr:HigA family addiction module antidote protein [Hyphomicrobiales bacterium]
MAGNPLLAGLRPTHPGEILREDVLPALNIPKTEIARKLGISRAMLYAILDEKAPVSPAMALRFAKLLGTSPEVWMNLQRDYDLRTVENGMAQELAAIERVARG